ncbi:MAG: L,D-transpeptidase family protein [Acidimicrobiales bacterium]
MTVDTVAVNRAGARVVVAVVVDGAVVVVAVGRAVNVATSGVAHAAVSIAVTTVTVPTPTERILPYSNFVPARIGRMVTAVLLAAGAAACGTSPSPTALTSRATTTPGSSASTAATIAVTTTEPPPSTTAATVATTLATTVAPATTVAAAAPTTTAATAAPATALPAALDRVGSARQAIVVTAGSYGATTATFTAYERAGGDWQEAYAFTARVGYNGVAPPGAKREGDGRTPSGVYGFDFMFGVSPNPGVSFPYRRVTPSIVWDDDPASPLYNQWVDRNDQTPGADPEEMYQPTAYAYGAVIAYNTAATPGLGSAIFLHASTGGATAGCVSLPVGPLVEVLRWLDPSQSPRIVIGVE